MICFPNCKINIGLSVTRKRDDGFHDIETVFYPVPLNDILEIAENKEDVFLSSGIEIPGDPDSNLCLKVLRKMREIKNIPCVKIHLHKAIPTGAGLGGGSSDAAFMIKLLNEAFSLNLTNDLMSHIAAELGSDCPFFIENNPIFASGRGNDFLDINLSLGNFYILIVKPGIHVNTAMAYSLIKPAKPNFCLKNINVQNIDSWKDSVVNDFELPVFSKFPEIKTIKDKIYECGAIYCSMSGSGSAVYGLFKNPVATSGLFDNCFVWQGKLK